MGRVFKDEEFARRARKARLADATLREAVDAADAGLVAAHLGGELVKLRVARAGGGKSGGFRTILAYRREDRAFFVYLFAKNVSENIDSTELSDLKDYAKILLGLTEAQIAAALRTGKLEEIE